MLQLDIQDLDFFATRDAVYDLLKEYRKLLMIVPVRDMPSVTQSFSFIPPCTNKSMNSIEQSAERNIRRQQLLQKRNELMDKLHHAIEELKPYEKHIIVYSQMQEDKMMDVDIYTELGISRTKYYELKNDAIVRLAFYLGIEVYESGKEDDYA
ncbi:ArpU family phage packaging/lysis transcriptional regulator [Salinicoccus carnicancri]|uniref:ArpU family phage packaging/lysis transcriptional regulator n=1 Tax=Salinicoccus carnicancri TaxID=558170 RepID=UPI00031DD33D|nr:ArpU family phage packaging/lysis transcriptional regulator [Salinicoccus carnicancri]